MKHAVQKHQQGKYEVIELSNGKVSASIAVNLGNTVFSFRKEDRQVLYFPFTLDEYKASDKLGGIPFLHPWANRLNGDFITIENHLHLFPDGSKHLIHRDWNGWPLHGLLMKSNQWKTIKTAASETSAYHIAEHQFRDEAFLQIFPFVHSIQIKHELKDSVLSVQTTVQNSDDKPMPISFGYHTYYSVDMKAENVLEVPANNTVGVDDKLIPTGKDYKKEVKWNFSENKIKLRNVQFDDCFYDLNYDNNGFSNFRLNDIIISQDENYPFNQVYFPNDPNKPYICIEPMTAVINGLNTNACKMIRSHEKFSATFQINA